MFTDVDSHVRDGATKRPLVSKKLLAPGTGASLTDFGLQKLASVAAKFRFIPLSEKPIERRHAVVHKTLIFFCSTRCSAQGTVVHKTLKKASNAGCLFEHG